MNVREFYQHALEQRGFAADSTVICSDKNFASLCGFPPGRVSMGLLRVSEGALEPAREALRGMLPPDADIMTRAEILARETDHWVNQTSTGRANVPNDIQKLPLTQQSDVPGAYPPGRFAVPAEEVVRLCPGTLLRRRDGSRPAARVPGSSRRASRVASRMVSPVMTRSRPIAGRPTAGSASGP